MDVVTDERGGHGRPEDLLVVNYLAPAGGGHGLDEGGGEGISILHHINIHQKVVFDLMRGEVTAIFEEAW